MPELKPQIIVRDKSTGKVGVLCTTIYLLTSDGDDSLSVVFDGDTPITLNCVGGRDNFEVIGPENAIADPVKCGSGKGAACCKFMVVGAGGFECTRHSSMRYDIIFRRMTAEMEPVKLYPACQDEIAEAVAKQNQPV